MQSLRPRRAFFQRRQCLVPTWRGWLLLALLAALLAGLVIRATHPFLAVNEPVASDVLVVEGWLPDYAIVEATTEFRRGSYRVLLVTGGPLEKGAPLSEYQTIAELGTATLKRLGFDPAKVQAVPSPEVRQDRTYASAIVVKEWLLAHGPMPAGINVMSLGAHARRSRLLYEKAFAGTSTVGMISVEEHSYQAARWWTSSEGFRTVTGEVIAYTYARLLFRAPRG